MSLPNEKCVNEKHISNGIRILQASNFKAIIIRTISVMVLNSWNPHGLETILTILSKHNS